MTNFIEGEYSAPDEMSAEYEVQDFLYGFIRLAKPVVVVETGSYHGHTARRMAEALAENGKGKLWTCDTEVGNVGRTFMRLASLPATVKWGTGVELIKSIDTPIDLVFLDSGDRVAEAKELIHRMARPGWVILHDTLRHHREEIWEIKGVTNWGHLELPYGRGLTLFQPFPIILS